MPAPAPPAPGFGELIRDARRRLGKSGAQVATEVGCHQTTVSGWERGDGWTGLDEYLPALAVALELDEDELTGAWLSARRRQRQEASGEIASVTQLPAHVKRS